MDPRLTQRQESKKKAPVYSLMQKAKSSAASSRNTLERARPFGYLPDLMESLLPPFVFGNPLKSPHLVAGDGLLDSFNIPPDMPEERIPAEDLTPEEDNKPVIGSNAVPSSINQKDEDKPKNKAEVEDRLQVALGRLLKKAADLDRRGEKSAAHIASALYTELRQLTNNYSNSPGLDNYLRLRNDAHNCISYAINKELGKHRDCRYILANIVMAILMLGVFYAVAVRYNGGIFFKKTRSEQLALEIEDIIKTDLFQGSNPLFNGIP